MIRSFLKGAVHSVFLFTVIWAMFFWSAPLWKRAVAVAAVALAAVFVAGFFRAIGGRRN